MNADVLRDVIGGWSRDDIREWLLGGLREACERPDALATEAFAPLVLTAAEPWSSQLVTAIRLLAPRDGERVRTVLGHALAQTATTADPTALPIELWRMAAHLTPPGDTVAAARHVLADLRHGPGQDGESRDLIDAVFAAVRGLPFDERVSGFFEDRRHAPGWRVVHARAYVLYVARREPSRWHHAAISFADDLAAGLRAPTVRRDFAERLLAIVGLPQLLGQWDALRTEANWLHVALTGIGGPLIVIELEKGHMVARTATSTVRYPVSNHDTKRPIGYIAQDELDDESDADDPEIRTMLTAKVASAERSRISTAATLASLRPYARAVN